MTIFEFEQLISGIDENRNGKCHLLVRVGTEDDEKELNLGLVGTIFRHVSTENGPSLVEVDIIFRNPAMQQLFDLFDVLKIQNMHLQENGVPKEQYAVCLQFAAQHPDAVGGIIAVAPYTWSLTSEKPGMVPDRIRLLFSDYGYGFLDPDEYKEEMSESDLEDCAEEQQIEYPWENQVWTDDEDDNHSFLDGDRESDKDPDSDPNTLVGEDPGDFTYKW